MRGASHLPTTGEVFLDDRGGSRALRVSWHTDAGVVVLSLWREGTCAGTFRLGIDEVPDLIDILREGLARAYDDAHVSFIPGMRDADHIAADLLSGADPSVLPPRVCLREVCGALGLARNI